MTQFGTPDAGDAVARVESVLNNAVDRAQKLFEETLDKAVPRELGSQPVPKEDELNEYVLTIAQAPDPAQAAFLRMQEWAKAYGWPRARAMFLDYVERNEKRLENAVRRS